MSLMQTKESTVEDIYMDATFSPMDSFTRWHVSFSSLPVKMIAHVNFDEVGHSPASGRVYIKSPRLAYLAVLVGDAECPLPLLAPESNWVVKAILDATQKHVEDWLVNPDEMDGAAR